MKPSLCHDFGETAWRSRRGRGRGPRLATGSWQAVASVHDTLGKTQYTFESALLEVAGRSASLGLPGLSLAKWVINTTDSRTQEGQAHSKVLCKNVHRDDKIQQDDSGKPSPSPPHKPRSTPQATKSVPATRPGRADGTRLWQGHAPSRFVLLCR